MAEPSYQELTHDSFRKISQDRDKIIQTLIQQNSELKSQVETYVKKNRATKTFKVPELRKAAVTKKQKKQNSLQPQLILVNISQCGNQIIIDNRAKIVQFSTIQNNEILDTCPNTSAQRQQLQEYCKTVLKELQEMKSQFNRYKQSKEKENKQTMPEQERQRINLMKKTSLEENLYKDKVKSQQKSAKKQPKFDDAVILSKVESQIDQQEQKQQQNEQKYSKNHTANKLYEQNYDNIVEQVPKTAKSQTPVPDPTRTQNLVASTPELSPKKYKPYIWQQQNHDNTVLNPKKSPQINKKKNKYKISYIRP